MVWCVKYRKKDLLVWVRCLCVADNDDDDGRPSELGILLVRLQVRYVIFLITNYSCGGV
jgi:hypothetical protein